MVIRNVEGRNGQRLEAATRWVCIGGGNAHHSLFALRSCEAGYYRLKQMPATTSLCFIVWNEAPGCEFDLPRVDFSDFDEIFAIDGGSIDRTAEILAKHGVVVHAQTLPSLNAAYWQAVETATCDNVVVFFPKGSLEPAILKTMKRLLLEGQELVVASRLVKGGRNEEDAHWFRPRKWGVKVLALLAAFCWRKRGPLIWDVLHGVKGFSRQAFLDMNPSRTGVSIDLEMTVRAYRLGLRMCEFPVTEFHRNWSKTHFKILPTGMKLGHYLWREFGRPQPVRGASKTAFPVETGRKAECGE